MLSVRECRRILGPECTLTDAQIESIVYEMRALAVFAVETWMLSRGQAQDVTDTERKAFPSSSTWDPSEPDGP